MPVCLEGEIAVDLFALTSLASRMFHVMLVAKQLCQSAYCFSSPTRIPKNPPRSIEDWLVAPNSLRLTDLRANRILANSGWMLIANQRSRGGVCGNTGVEKKS